MSKLCQCKLSDLAKHIQETVDTNTMFKEEVMEMLELDGGINSILESDCVCVKKEWFDWSCPHCEYSCSANYKKGLEECIAEHKELCPQESVEVGLNDDGTLKELSFVKKIGSITINKELSKDDTLIITNTFQYDDNGKEVGKSIGYEIKKEGPKPECDHIIGKVDEQLITVSNHADCIYAFGLVTDHDPDDASVFYFCPKKGCGAPIDWSEIEKKLNLKKDE